MIFFINFTNVKYTLIVYCFLGFDNEEVDVVIESFELLKLSARKGNNYNY
jgi:hypothetical protein